MVESLVFEGKSFVVDAEAVEDGGVEVADVDGGLHDVVAEVVGFPVHPPRRDPAACHPHAETSAMVVPT